MKTLRLQRSLANARIQTRCLHSTSAGPVLRIPKADVYQFGDPNGARRVISDLEWTVQEGESWAVVGSGSGEKSALLETLLGHTRLSPSPPGGLFPFLSFSHRPVNEHVSLVSFAHRPRASGGAFYDYTARYGAVRDEDRVTLRQSMFPEESGLVENPMTPFEWVAKLDLATLLDLPRVALSNGQTRRARIVKALLDRPDILLLDEPLTGLDAHMRPALLDLLHALHAARSPRVIMGLRLQDPIPDWVSHVALVQRGRVRAGPKQDVLAGQGDRAKETAHPVLQSLPPAETAGEALIEMRDLNVKYHTRHVLKDINWTIHAGERWHLQGANGSGKTTLLSVLTGDHPQSYTQRAPSALNLFGLPRRRHATPALRARIGVVSPELYNAWPRARAMSVWEAVGTGFDGGFVPMGVRGVGIGLSGALTPSEQAWREQRVRAVLSGLGPHAWGGSESGDAVSPEAFAERPFAGLSAGAQSVVLLMRALVGRPAVVLLDEVWAGMDEGMIEAARAYLRSGEGVGADQAVVVISHWEGEVPWTAEDGVRRFRLEEGVGRQV
ncbi:P-loop containing nucleoside triphosphate hydrolase protein [Amylostereum chailletii]|nr:P-loop containing nucleoside triphosphate hydrolase protein [Amylostereum chailletii]